MDIEYFIKTDKTGIKIIVMQRAYKTCPKIENYTYGYGTFMTQNADGYYNSQGCCPESPEKYIADGFKLCSKNEAIEFAQDPDAIVGDEEFIQMLDEQLLEEYENSK